MEIYPSDPYRVRIPTDWSLPKFALGELVKVRNLSPNDPDRHIGKIRGIQYLSPEYLSEKIYKKPPLWYYYVELSPDSSYYSIEPVVRVTEANVFNFFS